MFLIVVIGLALLAFIVGDALSNSRNIFGDQTTVAKCGDVKVDYQEYQAKREELNNRMEEARKQNPAQYANFDTQILGQMALEELINEKLVDKKVKDLGLQASGDQLRFYMMENPINPNIGTFIGQLNQAGISASTPQQAYEVIFNPKRNGLTDQQVQPFQRAWISLENETKQMVKRATYQQLLFASIKANKLDKKALYDDYVTSANLQMAFKPFENLSEKKYPVSDAELKKAYEAEKYRFAIDEPTKSVSVIAVMLTPSAADVQASRKLAQTIAKELRDSASQLSKEAKKEGIVMTHRELRSSDIAEGAIKNYVATAAHDSVRIVDEGIQGFTIVKMGRRTMAVDSIQVQLVQVLGSKLSGRVLAALNSGLPFDSIPVKFSTDSVQGQPAQWIPLYAAEGPTNALDKGQLDTLMQSAGRFIELAKAPEGALLAKVTEKTSPKEIVEFDEITYDLKPSAATVGAETQKLEKFLASATNAAAFTKKAAAAGYTIQDMELTQSTPALPRSAGMNIYYPESRQVVRWVMIDGEKGQVSHLYESRDANQPALYAVAINDEYEDFIPVTNREVKTYLTDKVRRDKAGDEMVKQFTGKGNSVAQIAAAMQVQPISAPGFRFAPNGQVRDAKVTGRIMGTRKGAPVVIVKGLDGVYAFQIAGNARENFPYDEQQYMQQYYQLVNPQASEMLRGAKKVVNKSYKFEAGD